MGLESETGGKKMAVQIIYEYESACGAKIRSGVIARTDEELTEYLKRLAKSGYDVIKATHVEY